MFLSGFKTFEQFYWYIMFMNGENVLGYKGRGLMYKGVEKSTNSDAESLIKHENRI